MENEQPSTSESPFRATGPTEQSALPIEQSESALTTPSPFCTGRCEICDSGYADKINEVRHRYTLRELSAYLAEEYGLHFSKDQLHLHFKKYAIKMRDESLALAYKGFRVESAHVAEHQKQVLFLASFTFEEILKRITNGTLKVGIEEFERMMKLYYQILRDPDGANTPDITEIYMRATKRYNVPLTQTSFDFTQPAVTVTETEAETGEPASQVTPTEEAAAARPPE